MYLSQSSLRAHALQQVLESRRTDSEVRAEQTAARVRDLLQRAPGRRQLVPLSSHRRQPHIFIYTATRSGVVMPDSNNQLKPLGVPSRRCPVERWYAFEVLAVESAKSLLVVP